MATKKVVKKVAAKKVAAKKPVKKPVAKNPAAKKVAAKKPAAKKVAAKKPAAKKPAEPVVLRGKNGRKLKPGKRVRAVFKRVPPKIAVKRVQVSLKSVVPPTPDLDNSKAVATAQSIALLLKQRAAQAEASEQAIRLTRRPTTRAQGKDTVKFPAADLKDFRKRLLEARDKALTGAGAMKATGFDESEDHEADGGDGTNQTLRLQALGHVGAINRTIQQIDEALHRIEDGSYGVCTICGQLIRKPRLINQPFVLTCMECQSEVERQGTK